MVKKVEEEKEEHEGGASLDDAFGDDEDVEYAPTKVKKKKKIDSHYYLSVIFIHFTQSTFVRKKNRNNNYFSPYLNKRELNFTIKNDPNYRNYSM